MSEGETAIKKFPTCETCKLFLKLKVKATRLLACETARACGACPKDVWRVVWAEKLQKIIGNCFYCNMNYKCRNPRHKIAKELLEALKP